jgi:hypothetical protein
MSKDGQSQKATGYIFTTLKDLIAAANQGKEGVWLKLPNEIIYDEEAKNQAIDELCLFLKTKPNLERLDLSRNKFGNEGIRKILDSIDAKTTSIRTLHLSANDLDDTGLGYVTEFLKTNTKIQNIEIVANNAGVETTRAFIKAVKEKTFMKQDISVVGNPGAKRLYDLPRSETTFGVALMAKRPEKPAETFVSDEDKKAETAKEFVKQ